MFGLSYSLTGMGQAVDTVNIYKAKCGVPYDIYTDTWFFKPTSFSKASTFEFSWNPKRENKQDSIVLEYGKYRKPYYYRVYNKKNRLLMEGGTDGPEAELLGDIKFYYSNGKLARIEHWDSAPLKDTCGGGIGLNDAPGPEGVWKYFRKNGSVKLQIVYFLKDCADTLVYKKTNCFKRNGEVKSSVETILR